MRFFGLLLLLVGCADVEPTDACIEYVSCIQAQDEVNGLQTDLVRFEAGGACWTNPDIAALCDRGCVNGMDWLQEAGENLPQECVQ